MVRMIFLVPWGLKAVRPIYAWGGSLDGVVVGVLVGWVAGGGTPGGGGGVELCPGALFGVLAVGVVEGGVDAHFCLWWGWSPGMTGRGVAEKFDDSWP